MAEKKFNLAEALGAVPDLGTIATGREQIEYIDIDRIDDDPNNFYELSGLDELAANIELCGLQQPIRVRAVEDGRFVIVSGHRRRAAIRKLVEDGRSDLRELPCIRERETGSTALQELRLIYANSDTRKLTSAEISKQAERVEALLYQLKEEGYEFPGRMRDHVAEACKLSKTKLSNLKVIRDNLEPKAWKLAWEAGQIADSVALAIAKLTPDDQLRCWTHANSGRNGLKYYYESDAKRDADALDAIHQLKCPEGGTCQHLDEKFAAHCAKPYYSCAGKCCGKCSDLGTCQHACTYFYEKIKQIKADKKEQRKQEKLAREEAERPTIQAIQRFWNRFGEARNAADKTVKECYKALGMYYSNSDEQKVIALECLEAKFSTNTNLPYGYSCYLSDVKRYVQIADLLGCSLDYLLCRTDNPKGIETAPAKAEQSPCELCKAAHPGCDQCCNTCADHCNAWQDCRRGGDTVLTEAPVRSGLAWYPTSVEPSIGQEIIAVDATGYAEDARYVRSGEISGGGMRWDEVTLWTPFPTEGAAAPATAPAEGWLPLEFVNGMEMPPRAGAYYCKFDCEGTILQQVAWWNSALGVWCFKKHGVKIDAKCLKWFPLPEDDDV